MWDVITAEEACAIVQKSKQMDPSKCLLDQAMERWGARSDNISVVVMMIDPPSDLLEKIVVSPVGEDEVSKYFKSDGTDIFHMFL